MEQSVKKSEQYVRERDALVAALERNHDLVLKGRITYNDFYESSIANLVSRHTLDIIPYNILYSLDPDDRIPAIQEGIRATKEAFMDKDSKEHSVLEFFCKKEVEISYGFRSKIGFYFGMLLSKGLRLGGLMLLTGNSWKNCRLYHPEGNKFDNEVFLAKYPEHKSLGVRGVWHRGIMALEEFHQDLNKPMLRNLLGIGPKPPLVEAAEITDICQMKVDNVRRLGDIEKAVGGSLSVELDSGATVSINIDDTHYLKEVLSSTDADILKAASLVNIGVSENFIRSVSRIRSSLPRFGEIVASWTQEPGQKKPLRPVSDQLLTAYMENKARPYEREYVELAAVDQPDIAETISIVRQVDRDEAMQASVNDGKRRMEFEDGEGSMKVVEISYDPDNDLYLVVGEGTGGRIQMKYDPRDDTVNSRSVGIPESLLGRMMPVLEECVRTVENTVRKEKDEELQKAQDKTFNPKV